MLVVGPAAVIEHRAPQVHRRLVRHQVMMHRVTAGVGAPRQQDDVAHVQGARLLFADRRLQDDFPAGALKAGLVGHSEHGA